MASVNLSRSKDTVLERSATITITPVGFSLPNNQAGSSGKIEYSNGFYQYSIDNGLNWTTFSSNSINHVFNGLKEGTENFFTIQCRLGYTASFYTAVPEVGYVFQGSETQYSTPIENIIGVYTHPGSFNIDASSGNIIAKVLTADKINNKWIPHYKNAYRWYYQTPTYPSTSHLIVTQNEPITATWFNNCMIAMNTFGKGYKTDYKGGAGGDLITASVINQLNFRE